MIASLQASCSYGTVEATCFYNNITTPFPHVMVVCNHKEGAPYHGNISLYEGIDA